ncbi:short-chain alcohol dehydrogenase [Neonectria punicea]|uniref:Short-chain alcohol dehydrogenase n=1 Tax=Neonectria punicea TaxID=979145 RepID=A0ABR1HA67_9HYPO
MLTHMWHQLSQLYPPKPTFTEEHLPELNDKVYIVTGASGGVGKELAQMLYSKNARVYVAARSEEKAAKAIDAIKAAAPSSTGELTFLHLDLADLTTISASAKQFLDRESKLHVLFNNAGVMNPAQGSKTAQGYELQLGVNNIGTFMFTKLLIPTLVTTAKIEDPGTVRVVWVASSAAESPPVPNGGVDMGEIANRLEKGVFTSYALSKAGNYLHAAEMAKRFKEEGIVSVPLNPGNLASDLWRTQGSWASWFLKTFVLHAPVYGAYTELFAGLSPQVTLEKSGQWIGPWGRFLLVRNDLLLASKTKEEGGLGTSEAFWDWTEAEIKPYL